MLKKVYLSFFVFSQLIAGDPIISNWYIGTRVSGGGPYNHYMEIVNPTNAPIDLSEYAIIKGHGQEQNRIGPPEWGNELTNSGESFFRFPSFILFPGQTYSISRKTVSHSALTGAADSLLDGDCVLGVSGDDAVGLFKGPGINASEVLAATDSIPIDAIGSPYYDPGTSWQISGEIGPPNSTGTSYYGVSRFAIVQRKSGVCIGNQGDWDVSRGCFEEDCDNDSIATAFELSEWNIIACYWPDEDGNSGPGYEPENPNAAVDVDSMNAYTCDCLYDGNNLDPEANSGSDQIVPAGTEFALSGSASSDPEDGIQTYYWVQIAGERILIPDPASEEINLTATDSLDTLSFVLHVIDDGFARDTDTVHVVVVEQTVGVIGEKESLPESFKIIGNYPNPFNPGTTISVQVLSQGKIDLLIYNVAGKKVVQKNMGILSQGLHNVFWNGQDESGRACPSGIYLYEFRRNGVSVFNKMSLLK